MDNKTLVKVMGRNPEFDLLFEYLWIDASIITTVYPIYAIQSDGRMWKAEPRQNGAEIVSYGLIDNEGRTYSCGNKAELAKIGFDPDVNIGSRSGPIFPPDGEQPDTIDLQP